MKRTSLVHFAVITVVCALAGTPAAAQDTRAESASQERAEKAQTSPVVQQPSVFQRAFKWAGKLEGSGEAKDGLYPELGGMIPGAGWLSAGPGYRHHLFGNAAVVDASAAMSWRRYSMMQSQIEWPALGSNHLSIGASAKYQDFTEINYFGIGSGTDRSAQTDYRLKTIDFAGSATLRPTDRLSVGGRVGYLRGLNIEPGLSSILPPTHDVFDETTAPGLTVQPRYTHADVFVEADTRDAPGYPTSGGVYRLGLATFHDLDASGQSFQRVDADATQYVPLFHRNWVVALRGRVTMSQTGAGNQVPFYLLPTLGGDHTLRGYANYRFRDRDAALVSAEYRWPVFRMMDAALFADAGTVAPTAGGLLRERVARDYGFGLRLHSEGKSFASIDVANGAEGKRISLSLGASFGGSTNNVIPYVP
jgi:outer membrane protein assembly factor BamA